MAVISSVAIIAVEIATKATCEGQGHSQSAEQQQNIHLNQSDTQTCFPSSLKLESKCMQEAHNL